MNEATSSPKTRAEDLICTIIIPVWNAEDLVEEQLAAVSEQLASLCVECIVVDDASTDDTQSRVRRWIEMTDDDRFRLVCRAARGGPNASRNTGIRESLGPFIVFIDGDDVVAPGWLAAMLCAQAPGVLLTGRVIDFSWEASRTVPNLRTGFPHKWNGWRFAHGGNMAASREVFTGLSGFDENILIGGSEIEFAIRAQSFAGVEVVGVPQSAIYYRQPISSSGLLWKNFSRERGYAYISITHQSLVSDVGWRIALFQLKSGLAILLRARTRVALYSAREQMARGVGRLVGRAFWRARFRCSLPTPRLLT